MKVRRAPQQKKLLSYQKDSRNTYAEARSVARKAIRLRKALARRALRRAETVALTAALHDPAADTVVARSGSRSWRKLPDAPLAKYAAQRLSRAPGRAAKISLVMLAGARRARYRAFACKGPLQGIRR